MSDSPETSDIPVEVVDAASAAQSVAPPLEPTVEERLAVVEREKKETHERLLRSMADLENFRKRTRRAEEDARGKGREDVIKEVLPVIDNLERALTAAGGDGPTSAIQDGVKLVLRQFQATLERFEVKGFAAVGEVFDPSLHEAIAQVESADLPAGSVVTELQRGYTIGGRLLRPALVTVSKAPPPATEAPPVTESGADEKEE